MAVVSSSNVLEEIFKNFEKCTKKPEYFLKTQENLHDDLRTLIKSTYDFTKVCEESSGNKEETSALPELIVKGFDDEQIWQELELQNDGVYATFMSKVSHLLAGKSGIDFGIDDETENSEELKNKGDDSDDEDQDLASEDENEDMEIQQKGQRPILAKLTTNGKPSVVDDKFFKLSEMERFLEQEDHRVEKDGGDSDSEEESVNYFASDSEEDVQDDSSEQAEDGNENGKKSRYSDFFDAPEGGQDDDEEGSRSLTAKEMAKTKSSTFERRQERIRNRIEALESEALSEKPWQLKGEVSAASRPENALLEEAVVFDHVARQRPVITEQTTRTLEEVITRRIKDRAWDDVERKMKPREDPYEYKKKLVLDHEKSKATLAEVYEQEYLKLQKQQEGIEESKENPEHEAIKKSMASLFAKLDALSNFHYTPKPPNAELKVVNNMPSIAMEEVAPIAISEAALIAPEEVKARGRGDLIGTTERSTTDMKRDLRKKKSRQREKKKEKERKEKIVAKLNPGLGNKYSKEKATKQLEKAAAKGPASGVTLVNEKDGDKAVKSSRSFFNQLQDVVSSQVQQSVVATKKRKDPTEKKMSAKKLKL